MKDFNDSRSPDTDVSALLRVVAAHNPNKCLGFDAAGRGEIIAKELPRALGGLEEILTVDVDPQGRRFALNNFIGSDFAVRILEDIDDHELGTQFPVATEAIRSILPPPTR